MDGTNDDPIPNIDDLTEEECHALSVTMNLEWHDYCNYVLPGCTYYFFVNGCDCLECSLQEIASGLCHCGQDEDREEE